MARISINNGHTYCTAAEALEAYGLNTLVAYIDDATREQAHAEIAPCTDEQFLIRYLEITSDDLIIG